MSSLPLPHEHDHDHAHAELGAHLGGHEARSRDAVMSRRRFSPFLASVLDRLLIAVVLSGVMWIGVVWAIH